MKKNILICAVLMASMIVAPLTAIKRPAAVTPIELQDDGVVSVMLNENGKIEEMDEREYVIGAVAAEMNASCDEEALKAQAVACYTYMRYTKLHGNSDNFSGADISDDSSQCQGYLNSDERKKKWGDSFEDNEKKLTKCVDSVLGKMITFNSEPILAVYHELNSGATESAEVVWGKDYPYLKSVSSAGDRLSTEYSKTLMLTYSEFMNYALKFNTEFSDEVSKFIGEADKSENGYVKSIYVCNKKITGDEFRKAFNLNSACFTVEFSDDKFTIKTFGKGHMVGMSQYGADYMARQGSKWDEIITHYYQNTEII